MSGKPGSERWGSRWGLVISAIGMAVGNGKEIHLAGRRLDRSGHRLMVPWRIIAMIITTAIVYRGTIAGIERANKVLIPTLFALLVVLVFRAVTLDGAESSSCPGGARCSKARSGLRPSRRQPG